MIVHLQTLFAAGLLAATATVHAQTECWAPRDEQDASLKAPAANLRKAVLTAEAIIRKDQPYLDAHMPVRMRTAIAIGPYIFTSARMFVNAYPEMSYAGSKVWTANCGIIPQADRIEAAVGQIGVFFNPTAESMMPPTPSWVPQFEGTVAGYPRYNGWIYMTKDGRLPWIAETLGQRLDREIAARQRKLDEWMKDPQRTRPPQDMASVNKTYDMLKKSDPAGAERYLASAKETAEEQRHQVADVYPAITRQFEKMLADAKRYRASFSAAELAMAAVSGDANGQGRKQMDARIQQLHAFPADEQQQVDAANREGRALERQAQDATRAGNKVEAERLRAQVAALSAKVRAMKKAHQERIGNAIMEESAQYELAAIVPGAKEQALGFVGDPEFFDKKNPYRIQLITVLFSTGKREGGPPWMKRAQEGFDFAALAAMLN